MHRRRSELTPLYVTTGVVALGEMSQYAPFPAVALGVAGCGVAVGSWVSSYGGDDRNKLYLWGVLAASSSAVLTLHEMGWSHFDWTAIIAAGMGMALGVPWWRNNRRRTRVTLANTVERWPSLARKLRMDTVRPVAIRAHGGGNFEGRLVWPAGDYTVAEILDKRERIEGALDLPAGTLRMERNGRDSNSVTFKAFVTDPHAEGINWEIPVEEVGGEWFVADLDARDPITLGYREDGELKTMTLTDSKEYGSRSVMLAGAKGSGKSGLVNVIVGTRVCCRNAVVWGVDLKGGMELGPWRNAMDWCVTTFDEAIELLEALEAVVDARAKYCANVLNVRRWPMTPEFPVLTVVVDECHSFNGAMNRKQLEMLERVIQKGRAVGVEIVEATQYPTLLAFGSNLVREQLDQRFCFRMQGEDGEYFVFGTRRDGKVGANMIAQSRPGTCYYQDAETIDRMPIRIQYVADDTVKTLVKLRQGRTCQLDETSANAALAVSQLYGNRPHVVPLGDDGEPVPGVRDTVPDVPDARDMSRDSGTGAGQGRDSVGHDGGTLAGQDVPEPTWLDGPDVPLADLVRLHEQSMTADQRDMAERARRALLDELESPKLSEQDAMEALVAALRAAGTEGVHVRDLAKAATRARSWTYEKLPELGARATKRGNWALPSGELVHSG
jgi:S-DNA-T family DNA segregation ATPase FtsK/SpoIIIE